MASTETTQSIKELWESLPFPAGVFFGAFLAFLLSLLKRLLEAHAPTVLYRAHSFVRRLVGFRAWEKKYRRLVANEHQYLRLVGMRQQFEVMPPKLEHVYVNLELQTPSSQSETRFLQPALTLRDTFGIHAILAKFQHFVILGSPGAGKTTLLKHLVALSACPTNNNFSSSPLPIYIALRLCLLNGRSLIQELTDPNTGLLSPELLRRYPKGYFETRLEKSRCILLFDGLDEVFDENRHVAAARLVESCAILYPKSKIIVTSRIAGWRGLLGSQFSRFVIRELSMKEIERLIDQWYLAVVLDRAKSQVLTFNDEIVARARRHAQELSRKMLVVISTNNRLQTIASTPLILSLMCLVYYVRQDLPERRAQLYEECSRVLLKEWDEVDKHLSPSLSLTYADKILLLQEIAIHLFRYSASDLTTEELKHLIAGFFSKKDAVIDSDVILQHIHERSGLIAEKALGHFGFAHLTFQEYFSAMGLLRIDDGLDLLSEKLRKGEGQEVALLLAGVTKNADDIVKLICREYQESGRFDSLVLSGMAVAESQTTSLEIKTEIVNMLNHQFDIATDDDSLLSLQKVLERLGVKRQVLRKFQDYIILEELGRGGFATTYKASYRLSGDLVALKVYQSGTGSFALQMADEINQLKTIRHKALVNVLDVGANKDQIFVAMELVRGLSLEKIYNMIVSDFNMEMGDTVLSFPMSDAEREILGGLWVPALRTSEYFSWVCEMCEYIVDGVVELHSRGILHGDLKPSNILISETDGRDIAKVSDYCVDAIVANELRLREQERWRKDTETKIRATVISSEVSLLVPFSNRYAPPELSQGKIKHLSRQVDVYSLGMVFQELFCLPSGRTVRRSQYADAEDLLRVNETYRVVSESRLSEVFDVAVSREVSKRFSTVEMFWNAVLENMPAIWAAGKRS